MIFFSKPKIIYEKITHYELDDLLKIQTNYKSKSVDEPLNGFKFLRKNQAEIQFILASSRYNETNNLRIFEKQEQKLEYDFEHDINIVALNNKQITGIIMLEWMMNTIGTDILWNYKNRFIEVNKNYRSLGIATNLLKTLEQLPEIQGKIIQFGDYEPDGMKFIKPIIPKIFSNNNYYIMPKRKTYDKLPKEFGCYINKII